MKIRFYTISTLATSTLLVFWNRGCEAERHFFFFDECSARKDVAQRFQKVFKVCSHVQIWMRAAVTTQMFLLLLVRYPDRHSAFWHRDSRTSLTITQLKERVERSMICIYKDCFTSEVRRMLFGHSPLCIWITLEKRHSSCFRRTV